MQLLTLLALAVAHPAPQADGLNPPLDTIPSQLQDAAAEIIGVLDAYEGLSYTVREDQLHIVGQSTEEALSIVETIARQNPQITNDAVIYHHDDYALMRHIDDAIDVTGVRARFIKETVILEGVVYSEALSAQAEAAASAYLPNGFQVVNVIEVRSPHPTHPR